MSKRKDDDCEKRLAAAEQLLRDLVAWQIEMGTWEAPVWRRAEKFLKDRGQ